MTPTYGLAPRLAAPAPFGRERLHTQRKRKVHATFRGPRPFAALGRILEEFNRGFASRLRLSLPWSVHRDMPPTTAAGGARADLPPEISAQIAALERVVVRGVGAARSSRRRSAPARSSRRRSAPATGAANGRRLEVGRSVGRPESGRTAAPSAGRVGRSGVPTQNLLRRAARGGSVDRGDRVGNARYKFRESVAQDADITFNFASPRGRPKVK